MVLRVLLFSVSNAPSTWDHVASHSVYLHGWSHGGAPRRVPPRDDKECERRRKTLDWQQGPSQRCPRCDEKPGAGVCPSPGSLVEFVKLFDKAVVICRGVACVRHKFGYWPGNLDLDVLDVDEFNKDLASRSHPRVARALGIFESSSTKSHWAKVTRHRVLSLLTHLSAVLASRARNHSNVLVLESDVRPVEKHALSAELVPEIGNLLRSRSWEILRPSGYYYDFSNYRFRKLKNRTCPVECLCRRWGNTSRVCVVAAGCKIKNTELYAVQRKAYPVFEKMQARALSRLAEINNVASLPNQSEADETILARFDKDAFPWIDLAIPTTFNSVLIVPQIVVQQTKQGDVKTSERFFKSCLQMPSPPPLSPAAALAAAAFPAAAVGGMGVIPMPEGHGGKDGPP